jgi:hypothetical protein
MRLSSVGTVEVNDIFFGQSTEFPVLNFQANIQGNL